jgi:SAM-dependent methyltransferase
MLRDDLIICPLCGASVRSRNGLYVCSNSGCPRANEPFPTVTGMPALIDFSSSIVDASRLSSTDGESEIRRGRNRLQTLLRLIVNGRNKVATYHIEQMLNILRSKHANRADGRRSRPVVLVVGGGTIGSGLRPLYSADDLDLIAFDVYSSPVVQFIADGHAIPLASSSVDGVVVQAVLEHVVDPWTVANEIYRVLRLGGIVFADTPFMQQVHEGPYDFTRFTDSGHRYLFRNFERIESGATAGAGAALAQSIEYFTRALTRSMRLGRLARLCFFWLRVVDGFLDSKYSLDGASGVYFLGRKTKTPIVQKDIVSYYQGGMSR